MWKAITVPDRAVRSRICQMRTAPVAVSAARIRASAPARPCVANSSRRRSTRSASTPAGREKRRIGSAAANDTRPSQKGESVSWRTSQPLPTCCIQVPTLETRLPNQRARKSGTASAPRREREPDAAASPANAASSGTATVAIASSGGSAAAARSWLVRRSRSRRSLSMPPRPSRRHQLSADPPEGGAKDSARCYCVVPGCAERRTALSSADRGVILSVSSRANQWSGYPTPAPSAATARS